MISKTKTGALLFLLLAAGYGWVALQIPLDFWSLEETFNARSLPVALAVAGIGLALLILVSRPRDRGWGAMSGLHWRPAAALVAWMALYGSTLELLGFLVATTLFLIGGFLIMGERSPKRLLAGSVPLVVLFWLVVGQLGIYLDEGSLFHRLTGG